MKIKEKIYFFVQKTIEEKTKGLFSFFFFLFKMFLYFSSLIFRFFVFIKNALYDLKLLKPKKIGIPIISIGNIVAGGTGKTPFTLYLGKKLAKRGLNVAIISRGYGARIKKSILLLDQNEKSPKEIGDEPFLISKRLPFCNVIVGRKKIRSIEIAKEKKVDVILLDDGFQSRKLHRDIDIVVLNAKKPFSNNHFLPRGFLRDNPKRLKKADLVVVNNANERIEDRKYLSLPAIYTQPTFSSLKNLRGEKIKNFLKKKVAVFCAIANPKRFSEFLQRERFFEIVEEIFLLDHASFDINFLKKCADKAKEKEAESLICTEKDAVKLPADLNLSLPVYYVEIDLKIIFNEEYLEEILLNNLK